MSISDEALEIMTAFSSGRPLMMQQIGESVFWASENEHILKSDAANGVFYASNEIGSKQIMCAKYDEILEFLADNNIKYQKHYTPQFK